MSTDTTNPIREVWRQLKARLPKTLAAQEAELFARLDVCLAALSSPEPPAAAVPAGEQPTAWEIIRAAEDVHMKGLADELRDGDRQINDTGRIFVKAVQQVLAWYVRSYKGAQPESAEALVAEPVAWQERQARRLNRATGEISEWSGWYEGKPRKATDPLSYTDPDDLIPREWRALYTSPQPAPAALPVALSDEQIIAIKKASRCGDPAKPWGDSLAFARAIIAALSHPVGAGGAEPKPASVAQPRATGSAATAPTPLTDEQIEAAWRSHTEDGDNVGGGTSLDGWRRAVRWALVDQGVRDGD